MPDGIAPRGRDSCSVVVLLEVVGSDSEDLREVAFLHAVGDEVDELRIVELGGGDQARDHVERDADGLEGAGFC